MEIKIVSSSSSPLAKKHGDDILRMYNSLDKEELDAYSHETGVAVRFTPAKTLASRMKGTIIIVIDEGRCMAFAQVQIFHELDVGILKLNSLYTDPSGRGRGYASALLEYLKKYAADKKCQSIMLGVRAGNPAKSVYDRAGFKVGSYSMYWTV